MSATQDKPSAGDPIPPKCAVIEVHIGELKQLFNAIDPSPFRDRDLDPKAEEFIVGWAKDLPRDATLALVVNLDRVSWHALGEVVVPRGLRRMTGPRTA